MLSDRLRVAMEKSGITQAELARACNVKPPSVHGWLSGKSKFLRGENLLCAARVLNVDQQWLATGEGPERRDHETPPPALPALQGQHMHLVDALEMVAHALALADPVDRAAVKAYLSGLCDAPDRADLREKIRTALEPPPSKHATLPAVESKDFQPPVPNPFVKAP